MNTTTRTRVALTTTLAALATAGTWLVRRWRAARAAATAAEARSAGRPRRATRSGPTMATAKKPTKKTAAKTTRRTPPR